MSKIILCVLVVFAIVYGTDCLDCASCTFMEPTKDIGVPEEELGDPSCKDGGAAINSTTCPEPAAGQKAVCARGKGKLRFEVDFLGQVLKLDVNMYLRECLEIDEDEPDEGDVPESLIEDSLEEPLEELFSDADELTVDLKSFNAKYCSTDNCAIEDDISTLSGVTSLLPSLLLTAVLTLLVRLF